MDKEYYEDSKTFNYVCKNSSLVMTITIPINENEKEAELYLKELLGIKDLPRGYFELTN